MAKRQIKQTVSKVVDSLRELDSCVPRDFESIFAVEKKEIARLKATQIIKTLTQKLLGDFDENGNYTIEQAILGELISIPKYIVKDEGSFLKLAYEYKDGTLFKMTCPDPVVLDDGSLYCTLVLNEEVDYANGFMTDTLSTVVGSFICEKGQKGNVFELRKKAFNIYKKEEITDDVKKPTDAIDAKFKLNSIMLKKIKNQLVDLEEIYFTKRKLMLDEMQGGASFASDFNKLYQSIEDYFVKGQTNTKYGVLNDLLNIMLDGRNGTALLANPTNRQMMLSIDNFYLQTLNNILTGVSTNRAIIHAQRNLAQALNETIYTTTATLGGRNVEANTQHFSASNSEPTLAPHTQSFEATSTQSFDNTNTPNVDDLINEVAEENADQQTQEELIEQIQIKQEIAKKVAEQKRLLEQRKLEEQRKIKEQLEKQAKNSERTM